MDNKNSWQNKEILTALVVGVIVGVGFSLIFNNNESKSNLIKEYYEIENAVSVSPHDLKVTLQQGIMDKNFIVVDLRSAGQYAAGHIPGAISVPASSEDGEDNRARLVETFRGLEDIKGDRDIITYCNSAACMLSRKVGLALAEEGIYVKHLNIGWNEWEHYWTLWNGKDGVDPEHFIARGEEPGEARLDDDEKVLAPCAADAEFSC